MKCNEYVQSATWRYITSYKSHASMIIITDDHDDDDDRAAHDMCMLSCCCCCSFASCWFRLFVSCAVMIFMHMIKIHVFVLIRIFVNYIKNFEKQKRYVHVHMYVMSFDHIVSCHTMTWHAIPCHVTHCHARWWCDVVRDLSFVCPCDSFVATWLLISSYVISCVCHVIFYDVDWNRRFYNGYWWT